MKQVFIAGNPNCGKSTLFTRLTGVHQKVDNYPGVTVEKKTATWKLNEKTEVLLNDLPGMYSLYPHQQDEFASYKELTSLAFSKNKDIVIVVLDATNLKRNLLLLSQLNDLDLIIVGALTMLDIAEKKGIDINISLLSEEFGFPVVPINPLENKGLELLSKTVEESFSPNKPSHKEKRSRLLSDTEILTVCPAVAKMRGVFPNISAYGVLHKIIYHSFHREDMREDVWLEIENQNKFISPPKVQSNLIMLRYEHIQKIVNRVQSEKRIIPSKKFEWDDIFLHVIWGNLVLLLVLFSCFQMLFWVADYPMQLIDFLFFQGSRYFHSILPDVWWGKLLVDGVWAGINGVVVFVPQIAFLFGITAILEASGYMARINLLLDRWANLFGLSGKSMVVFVNAFACAVPAIMAARNIENKKEQLSTILAAPFITCSARLPVYVILISILAPDKCLLGFIQWKGLLLLALYILGIIIAFGFALILKYVLPQKEKSIFIQELPIYRIPYWKNVIKEMYVKSRVFVVEAGKVIMLISLVIWLLSSYGFDKNQASNETSFSPVNKIEDSYLGHLGKWIEPTIKPLGYNWEIGVALLASFAAREVFISTISTIYSIAEDDDQSLIQRMRSLTDDHGNLVYSLATIISLLIFYALAMQCMSTFAVVKRETNSFLIPLAQLVGMSVLAYGLAALAYSALA